MSKTERTLWMQLTDGSIVELPIVKATKIKADMGMFHIDRVDGGYRILVSEDIMDLGVVNLDTMRMIRKD